MHALNNQFLRYNIVEFIILEGGKFGVGEPHTNHVYEKITVLVRMAMYVCSDMSSTCLLHMRMRYAYQVQHMSMDMHG